VGITLGDFAVDWVLFRLDEEGVKGLLLLGKDEGVPLLLSVAALNDLGVFEGSTDATDLSIA